MAVCCHEKRKMVKYVCVYSATLPQSRGQKLTCRTRRLTLTRCRQANTQQVSTGGAFGRSVGGAAKLTLQLQKAPSVS